MDKNEQWEEEQIEEATQEAMEDAQEDGIQLDEAKVERFIEQKRMEQNLVVAIIAGAVAAIVSAILWAVVTVATGYQIGYMAIAVGLIVGFAVRLGRGIDPVYGFIGAGFALLGCIIGNYLSMIGFLANEMGSGVMEALSLIPMGEIPGIMINSLEPMDFLFYGIALYCGYKYGTADINEEELIAQTRK